MCQELCKNETEASNTLHLYNMGKYSCSNFSFENMIKIKIESKGWGYIAVCDQSQKKYAY